MIISINQILTQNQIIFLEKLWLLEAQIQVVMVEMEEISLLALQLQLKFFLMVRLVRLLEVTEELYLLMILRV